MNEYYVYVWIREDYNTVFYIGKGKNQKYVSRAERIKNNIHFKRIYEKVPTHYEIIHNNLTEQEALDLYKEIENGASFADLADQVSPFTFTSPVASIELISESTIPCFPISE